jgi:hypothetical protein
LNSIDSNVGIINSRILQIIQDRRHLNNGMKYKLMTLLKCVIDLDVDRIQDFAYGEEGVISTNFLKEISMFNNVIIEPSIFIFHPLNSLYFFLKEDPMVIKPIKSILRSTDDSSHSRYSKKVRIITDTSDSIDNNISESIDNNDNDNEIEINNIDTSDNI